MLGITDFSSMVEASQDDDLATLGNEIQTRAGILPVSEDQ